MSKRFVIKAGETFAVAELLEQEAPIIARHMWETLTLDGFAVHAKFAGQEIISMVPFYAEPENEILDVQPGDIGYYPGRQTICIFYGDTKPFGYVSVFARIVEKLDALHEIGERILQVGIVPVTLEKLTGEADARVVSNGEAQDVSAPEFSQATTQLLDALRVLLQRWWNTEPPDIVQLRSITRPPMGNLPCCFYANFNLFWSGESLQVICQQVKDGALPVLSANLVVAELLARHAARLEKWSMHETVALERSLIQYLRNGGATTGKEFTSVIASALLVLDRIQSWIDALLPWGDLDAQLALRRPISVS